MDLETHNYSYNLTSYDTYAEVPYFSGMDGSALSKCIIFVIEVIMYIFITAAIAADRNRYQTTFWFTLLNFSVTYIPLNVLRYFGEVHIFIYPESNKSVCHLVHFLNSTFNDGGEIAIILICVDLIVQNLMSERYENPKYKIFTLILIFMTWLLVIIKEIIFKKHAEIEYMCYQSNPPFVMWGDLLLIIIRIVMTLAAVGVLLYIGCASGQPASQLIGVLGAPIMVSLVLCFSNLFSTVNYALSLVDIHPPMSAYVTSQYIRIFCPMVMALLWLVDNNFRASIKRIITCSICHESGHQPTEHEMTTDIA